MSQEHADRLADILMLHARAVERRQFVEAIACDDEFHRAITGISNLPRLWSAIEISKAQLDRCRYLMVPRDGQAEATLEQHREIIRALNSRDPARGRSGDEGASRRRLPQHRRRSRGSGARVARNSLRRRTAGTPHHQFRLQQDALCRLAIAVETRHEAEKRGIGHGIDGLTDGGEGRRKCRGPGKIIDSGNRDIAWHRERSGLRHGLHDTDQHLIVSNKDGGRPVQAVGFSSNPALQASATWKSPRRT